MGVLITYSDGSYLRLSMGDLFFIGIYCAAMNLASDSDFLQYLNDLSS